MKGTIYPGMVYRGWYITRNVSLPVTGQWRAVRHGVGMCHGTAEGLQSMIKNKEDRNDKRNSTGD